MEMRRLVLAGLLVLGAGACDRCGGKSSSQGGGDAALATSVDAAPARALRARKRGSDVTFLVVSDTHFGFGGIPAAHEVLIPKLNHIAGREYPSMTGGVVAVPRG